MDIKIEKFKNVARYDPIGRDLSEFHWKGDYVMWEDYAKLLTKFEELLEDYEELRESWRDAIKEKDLSD